MNTCSIVSPVDQSVVHEFEVNSTPALMHKIDCAKTAQKGWQETSFQERVAIIEKFNKSLESRKEKIGELITLQMGRPILFSPGEVTTAVKRSEKMLELLKEESFRLPVASEDESITKFIDRVPVGVVTVFAAWNYPMLTAVNSIVPAILCGNSVLLKHSAQTYLCGEAFKEAFVEAGLPENVFQTFTCDHEQSREILQHRDIARAVYTGSVGGGQTISEYAAGRFMELGLELGGKDPAYVMSDAKVIEAAVSLCDGAFFNSGQSCCSVERIYVDDQVYDQFVEVFAEEAKKLVVGDPKLKETTMGPLAKMSGVKHTLNHIKEGIEKGARPLLSVKHENKGNYLSPEVFVDVNHEMLLMTEESFGPIVGIMRVSNEQQAIKLMNDSCYGLTASVWTQDQEKAIFLGKNIETGTVMMNRCDYVDPSLAWTGVKDTGVGFGLSELVINSFTRPKSYLLIN